MIENKNFLNNESKAYIKKLLGYLEIDIRDNGFLYLNMMPLTIGIGDNKRNLTFPMNKNTQGYTNTFNPIYIMKHSQILLNIFLESDDEIGMFEVDTHNGKNNTKHYDCKLYSSDNKTILVEVPNCKSYSSGVCAIINKYFEDLYNIEIQLKR